LGSLVPHGLKDATCNRARILAWWTRHPQANIGLATGHRFDILDVDGPEGAHYLGTPPGQVPAVLLERLQPRQRQRPSGPVQLPAAADGSGGRYGRAALAEELALVAAAPKGQRNRQLWESTRNLYNLVAAGTLDHHQVHQGLLQAAERCGLLAEEPRQTHRTLASGRQVGLAHPRPAPDRTRPDPAHASPPLPARAGGERTQEGR
jgi:hypothetical protein